MSRILSPDSPRLQDCYIIIRWPRPSQRRLYRDGGALLPPGVGPLSGAGTGSHRQSPAGLLFGKDRCASNQRCLFPSMLSK